MLGDDPALDIPTLIVADEESIAAQAEVRVGLSGRFQPTMLEPVSGRVCFVQLAGGSER